MNYEFPNSRIEKFDGDEYLVQEGDIISMKRPVSELLECERERIQLMDYYSESE